jgi:transcription elongation GreA/GreB family factor
VVVVEWAAWASEHHPVRRNQIFEGRLQAAFFFWRMTRMFASYKPLSAFSPRGICMRAFLFCLAVLLAASADIGFAQTRLPKADPTVAETRYFTAIDGLMDGNADVILKETRQGKTVSAATLDVCYPVDKNSDRKDRFVLNLAVNGQTFSGTTQSIGEKAPVSVKLVRKQSGDNFDFRGQISIGQTVTEVVSSENSDISEKEFQDSQTVDDGITAAPKDFTDVSPEAVGVRIKLDATLDFLKSLKGQDVEVALSSLAVSCDELRAGQQTINLSVDPDRAAALIAKAKSTPGVVAVGWTAGVVEMDRTMRFSAADWRDGDKLNREKLASTISAVLAKTLAAKPASSSWSALTGKLRLTFKRPSELFPPLNLTDTIEVAGIVSPDKPGGSDRLMLWISNPVTTTADESTGAKLNLSEESSGDEEGDARDDSGSVEALAKELKAQRWDADKSVWK